jgi:tetratricopeptide (TPR) repeat protein
MGRVAALCTLVVAISVVGVFAQDTFERERQAALAQVTFVEQAYAERLGADGTDWRARVKTSEPVLVEAITWFSRNAEGDQALRVADPLAYFWSYDGHTQEARSLLARVLALPSAAAPTVVRAKGLCDAGLLAFRQGDQDASRAFNDESLRIYRRLDDKGGIAMALIGLSRVALRELDYTAVRKYAEESAILRREIGDKRGEATAVDMLAAVARMQGQYSKASELYQFSLDVNREAGNDDAVAGELFNLGSVRLRQRKVDAARALFTESTGKYRALDDEVGVAFNLTGFANIAVEQKQPARAARLYAAAMETLERLDVTLDPDDQFEVDHFTAKLLTLLPSDAFDAASRDGRTLSLERATALALAAR